MSSVKNQICKVIPQLSPSKSSKKKAVKEKPQNEQTSKGKSKKTSKEKATKQTKEDKKSKTEKKTKKGLLGTERNKESLSFKDLNSHFNSVQFNTKQTPHGNDDPISGQIDQLTSHFSSTDRPAGNDLEELSSELNSAHSSKHFPFHFIGVSLKSQTSQAEDDR